MKKTDIAMIILIAAVGVMLAYFVAINIPFLKVPDSGVKVKTMRTLSSEVEKPDDAIFHGKAINPTVEVIVGHKTIK